MTEPDEMTAAIPEEFLRDGNLDLGVLGVVAWLTDVGHVRQRNEDRLLVRLLWGGSHILLLVADGAGGHERGDKAAEQVVLTFDALASAASRPPAGGEPEWLTAVICKAHVRVRALSAGETRPPASTVVGLLIETASLCAWRFHVGDSRIYSREQGGMVAQLTRDHNIANGLIDRGLSVSQAMKVAEGARLTQVLGGGVDQEPEIHGPLQLQSGQCVLIASDGAFGHNGDREVLLPAMKPGDFSIQERCAGLKAAVLAGEAPDNLTAVLWEVPGGLIASIHRDTVTNSMKALTDEDVTKQVSLTGADRPEDDEGPALWSSATLVALLLVAAIGLSVMRLLGVAPEHHEDGIGLHRPDVPAAAAVVPEVAPDMELPGQAEEEPASGEIELPGEAVELPGEAVELPGDTPESSSPPAIEPSPEEAAKLQPAEAASPAIPAAEPQPAASPSSP